MEEFDISKVMSGPGNPFVFNQMDYLMSRIKKEDTLHKYHMLLRSGKVILEDYWCWHGHKWHKELIRCLNDFYIVVTTEVDVISIERIDELTLNTIYMEYVLASKLRGDGIDGDSIYDVRLERKWKDYICEELRKNQSHSLRKS